MAASFSSIPQGTLRKNDGETVPVGEVAVLSLDRRTSENTGREYTHSATFLTPDDIEHECRVGTVLGRQLASLESLPARVTIEVKVSKKGNSYKTIAA